MDVQARAVKVMKLRRQLENFLHQRTAHRERLRIGLFIKLPNVVGGLAVLAHLDLHEFRETLLENFAEGNCRSVARGGDGLVAASAANKIAAATAHRIRASEKSNV